MFADEFLCCRIRLNGPSSPPVTGELRRSKIRTKNRTEKLVRKHPKIVSRRTAFILPGWEESCLTEPEQFSRKKVRPDRLSRAPLECAKSRRKIRRNSQVSRFEHLSGCQVSLVSPFGVCFLLALFGTVSWIAPVAALLLFFAAGFVLFPYNTKLEIADEGEMPDASNRSASHGLRWTRR